MTEDDRITIIAESFEAAALEFHRRNLASEGYRMVGPKRKVLFDGNPMFAVTFAREGD